MAAARFDLEKFTGSNDFGLWRIKMRAILIQQGLADALIEEADPKKEVEGDERVDEKLVAKKKEVAEKAYSTLILSLSDRVLREVSKETTAAGIWTKLEGIYCTKSLANRLYMKQKLYSYKFVEGKGVTEQLEEFNKSIDDLENIDVKIEDEDKAIMLLSALPKSFEHLKDAMLFGRQNSISFEEVQSALKAKDFQKNNTKVVDLTAESLNVSANERGNPKKKGAKKQKWQKGKKEDQKESRSCHWCKKPGHLKKDCFAWKRKQAPEGKNQNNADCVEGVELPEIMNVMDGGVSGSWIMDSGCSFHMCPYKHWFQELNPATGTVLLGNNQICNIKGVGMVKFKMADVSVKVLSDVRYIPEIKRNLISPGLL